MQFIAVDVETANPNYASICQIGTVVFVDGQDPKINTTYVNPEDYFHPMNTAVHGIAERHVKNAKTFPQLHKDLSRLLSGQIVVCHTSFDRVAFRQACDKYGLPEIDCRWLDTARVARRAWAECADRGYGLAAVAEHLGIKFLHHDAGQDAWASGQVMLRAIEAADIPLEGWFKRTKRPIRPTISRSADSFEPNPDGPLFGEVVVFTGALSIPRPQAQQIAADAGCQVAKGVTKKTTILVVGDQDIKYLAGHDKSSKHRRAEELAEQGQDIRIVGESDFRALAGMEDIEEPVPAGEAPEQKAKHKGRTLTIIVIAVIFLCVICSLIAALGSDPGTMAYW